ncbi:hypothetical protein KXD40_007513 [Peronospora effusa]|nr:hypothetical protein KXD40_007513 [Peronospora effusa]
MATGDHCLLLRAYPFKTQVIIVDFYAPIHSKCRFIIANPLPGNDSQNRRTASVATHSHAGGRGS